jgi:predicted TIM-barrel fold metal-dependent hydrolase
MAGTDVQDVQEDVLEPDLPIIDPHHHLWDYRAMLGGGAAPEHPFFQGLVPNARYLLDELLADVTSGHDVRATVFIECGAMYRAGGDPELACVGETEFVNGVAAMSASGTYGDVRACAGIVGHIDLTQGEAAARRVLEAHLAAGGGRFRGVRHSAAWDADPGVLGPLGRLPHGGLYVSDAFRAGFAALAPMGLSFDAWLMEPQLPDLVDLARRFEDTTIVLDHVGTPVGIASYAGQREARFPGWRENIRALARSPNVVVKLGGLAMPFAGFPFMARPEPTSAQLAEDWRPYIETCIEAFGPERCMFESNFPVDAGTCSYRTLWNALKRLAAGCSADEKTALFSDTARRVYRLEI